MTKFWFVCTYLFVFDQKVMRTSHLTKLHLYTLKTIKISWKYDLICSLCLNTNKYQQIDNSMLTEHNFLIFLSLFLKIAFLGHFSHDWCSEAMCHCGHLFVHLSLIPKVLSVLPSIKMCKWERQTDILEDKQSLFVHVYVYLLIFDTSVNFIHPSQE